MSSATRTGFALVSLMFLTTMDPVAVHATGGCGGTVTVTQSGNFKTITVKTTDDPICLRISEAAGTLSFVSDPPGTLIVGSPKATAGVTKLVVKLANHRNMLTLSTLALPGVDLIVKGGSGGNTIVMDQIDVRKLSLNAGKEADLVSAADVTVEKKSKLDGGKGAPDRLFVLGSLDGPIDAKNFENIQP